MIDRVEPYCAIENNWSQASRAARDSPGPSWPNSSTQRRGSVAVSSGRLPGRVLVAASAVGPAERLLAGLAAIAAGRAYDSDLTRAVVSSIYAERATPAPAGHPVLDDCRRATGILGARADPGDSAAYRQWVQLIAARACRPAATELERRFLADVRAALAL